MHNLSENQLFLLRALLDYFDLTAKGLQQLERVASRKQTRPRLPLPSPRAVVACKAGQVSPEMFQRIVSAVVFAAQVGKRNRLPDGREVTEATVRSFLWPAAFNPKLLLAALTREPPDIAQIEEQGNLLARQSDIDIGPLLVDPQSRFLEALKIPYFKGDQSNPRGRAHLKVVTAVIAHLDPTETRGNVHGWHQVAAELSYRYAGHGVLHRAVDGMQFVQETSRPKSLTDAQNTRLEYLIGDYGCVLTPKLSERLPLAAREWPDEAERANMTVKAQHCIACSRFREGNYPEASSALDVAEFMLLRLPPNAISPALRHLRRAYILLIRSKLHCAAAAWDRLAATAEESVQEFRAAASESIDHTIAQAYSYALLAGAHLHLGHRLVAVMAATRAEALFDGCTYQFSCLFDYPKVRAALQAILRWNASAGAPPEFDLNAWNPEGLKG